MQTTMRAGEEVIRKGRANLQRGIETAGGRLMLTNQRLVFESHKLNAQRGATDLELDQIAEVSECWTKLFGIIPLVQNSISVKATTGVELKLVLDDRAEWIQVINGALPSSHTASA
mgnify:CR=1 FL=1